MKKLEIVIDDLKHNLNLIKKSIGDTKIIAVVKANGMGLDLVQYSRFLTLNGVHSLAVANVEEAIILRNSRY